MVQIGLERFQRINRTETKRETKNNQIALEASFLRNSNFKI